MTTARYSRSRSAVRLPGGVTSRPWFHFHHEVARRVALRAAPAMPRYRAVSTAGLAAARQPNPIHHLGNDAHGRVVIATARDEEDAIVFADVHG